MSTRLIHGKTGPVEISVASTVGPNDLKTVFLGGLVADLEETDPASFCEDGRYVEEATITPGENGHGTMTIRCPKCDNGAESLAAIRTTYSVDMVEVTYDLAQHPTLKSARAIVEAWLATDASKRRKDDDYQYVDASGAAVKIEDETALLFCAAFDDGIKTFNRYYPVINEISYWQRPPGMTVGGYGSVSGDPEFSDGIGTFSAPPISLNGYADTNWFLSKDSWQQNGDRTWTRTRQWTYTPEGSASEHAWIYAAAKAPAKS